MTSSTDWYAEPSGALSRLWRDCLTAAGAAPSVHNTQPWRFRVTDNAVDVLADRSRHLEFADPADRELLISVGAAIANLRVAMLDAGRRPSVRLWPDPTAPDFVARVSLGPSVAADQTTLALAAAIPVRRTNRQPFDDAPLSDGVIDDLRHAAQSEGADLAMADTIGRMLVLSVVRRAEELLRGDPRYVNELARWSGNRRGCSDGVPADAFGPWTAVEWSPIRTFAGEPDVIRSATPFEANSQVAVLYTFGDTAQQWVRAGQALERVLLTATAHGVAVTMMTQPMELPAVRRLLADPRDDRIVAQAALRLGYAPASPATPRRPLGDLIAC